MLVRLFGRMVGWLSGHVMGWLLGAAALLVLYVLALAGLFVFQRRILFHPDTTPPDLVRAGRRRPADDHHDGRRAVVMAWYYRQDQEGGRVVLYLHGNAGHIGHRGYRLEPMRRLGWASAAGVPRLWGNPGRPSEAGLLRDAHAGLAALRAMGIGLDRILVWGKLLGSGLAVRLAVEHPVAAAIFEAPCNQYRRHGAAAVPIRAGRLAVT